MTAVDWDPDAAEKGGYENFMLKEIHEQPARSGTRSVAGCGRRPVVLAELGMLDEHAAARRVIIVALRHLLSRRTRR